MVKRNTLIIISALTLLIFYSCKHEDIDLETRIATDNLYHEMQIATLELKNIIAEGGVDFDSFGDFLSNHSEGLKPCNMDRELVKDIRGANEYLRLECAYEQNRNALRSKYVDYKTITTEGHRDIHSIYKKHRTTYMEYEAELNQRVQKRINN